MSAHICPVCNTEYMPLTVVQIYCSKKCARTTWGKPKPPRPSVTFTCAYWKCGRVVVTETDRPDKRSRFCCAECEKKYWRHPPKESMLRNYHRMEEYASYERRDNR